MPYVAPARRAAVDRLATTFVRIALGISGVSEGRVRGRNTARYRRLDCDGRALAFVRGRPSAGGVRIDLSGLWVRPARSRLEIVKPAGPPSLLLRAEHDVPEALAFLDTAVQGTRHALTRERSRPASTPHRSKRRSRTDATERHLTRMR